MRSHAQSRGTAGAARIALCNELINLLSKTRYDVPTKDDHKLSTGQTNEIIQAGNIFLNSEPVPSTMNQVTSNITLIRPHRFMVMSHIPLSFLAA